uniref:Uncharacterized protein n=1 Tax=Sphaeramia orbicularis TaxID=375764 RepID=A0A673CAM8_9TELE
RVKLTLEIAVPLLTNLQLYHTSLDNLPSDLLKDVPHLNTLDLTGNRLVHLPPNVFHRTSLQSLVLKNNLIEKVDSEWFPHNSSLTWLDLSGNRLTSIPADLLQRLPHMRNLDLSDNNLQDLLNLDSLNHLHHLETLNLAGNKLTQLKATTFTHNLQLSQLFLHNQESKRQRVCDLLNALVTPKEISKIVGVSIKTVYNGKKRMTMSKTITRKSGRYY